MNLLLAENGENSISAQPQISAHYANWAQTRVGTPL